MQVRKQPKMIYIKWLDHYSHGDNWGKADYSEAKDGLECETVGFLMHETKKSYHIALNFTYKKDNNSQTADSMTIIKSCVIKKKILRLNT